MTQLLTDKKSEDEYSVPLTARPAIAHLIRAMSRFGARLGNQFGAAITYFLVLAMIPTLMFAFSALGFFLDVVRPELVDTVNDYIESSLGSSDEMAAMLTNFISNNLDVAPHQHRVATQNRLALVFVDVITANAAVHRPHDR